MLKVNFFRGHLSHEIYAIKFKGEIVYVGVTKAGVTRRVYNHFRDALSSTLNANNCPLLYPHIRENPNYNDYEVDVLEQCKTVEAGDREKYYIAKFSPRLNATMGGVPCGPQHYLYGRKVDTHTYQASVAVRIGKPLSEAHKQKLREVHARRAKRAEYAVTREDGKIYAAMSLAAIDMGVTKSAIHQAIRHGSRCGGFKFKYSNSDLF